MIDPNQAYAKAREVSVSAMTNTPESKPELESFYEKLNDFHAQLCSINTEANAVATRLFGDAPAPSEALNDAPVPGGMLGRLGCVSADIQSQISALGHEVQRLSKLA